SARRVLDIELLVLDAQLIQHLRSHIQIEDCQVAVEIRIGGQTPGGSIQLDLGQSRSGREPFQGDPAFRAMALGFDFLQGTRQLRMAKFPLAKLPMEIVGPSASTYYF